MYARAPRHPLLVEPWWVCPGASPTADGSFTALAGSLGAGGGAGWPSASLAIYIPFSLPVDAVIDGVKFNCTSGTSAGRNYDLGFFDAGTFAKLSSSGATLVGAGINVWSSSQYAVGGQPYYLGMSLNNTSLQVWRWSSPPTALSGRALGMAQEASANPLPSTMTPAQYAQTYLPGVTFTFANLP